VVGLDGLGCPARQTVGQPVGHGLLDGIAVYPRRLASAVADA
jgi:hypothetical protein